MSSSCELIGMVHLKALPGSPSWGGKMGFVLDEARRDAELLLEGGCDKLLVENMGDLPYVARRVALETIAALSIATGAIVEMSDRPVGLQVLAAANDTALSVAAVTGASFIRVEGFAYAHVADEGWIDACAGNLLRKRKSLGADVAIWADVQKKHSSHAVTADLSIGDLAEGAVFCGADGLIVTGSSTGKPTSIADLQQVKSAGLPVYVGSGVNPENLPSLARIANGVIVGSWLKKDGNWRNPVSVERVKILRAMLDNE